MVIQNLSGEVLLKFYVALYASTHFCIYCHLACFCITPFGTSSGLCITLNILCSGVYFCLCLLVIHITFPSLQYSALQYSFCSDYVFSFLLLTHFVSDLCQQPF